MDRRKERRGRSADTSYASAQTTPGCASVIPVPVGTKPRLVHITQPCPASAMAFNWFSPRWCLWLAGDAAPQAGRALGLDRRRRAPLGDLDDARVEQVQAVEEARDHLAGAAHVVALGQVLVHPPDHLGHRLG